MTVKQNQLNEINTTLVLGASDNPNRYAYLAIQKLVKNGYKVEGVGAKSVSVEGIQIYNFKKQFSSIDTVTLYLSASNQVDYYEYIIQLNPRRVIFNPGTHNPEFENLLNEKGIEVLHACTLVLLSTQQY